MPRQLTAHTAAVAAHHPAGAQAGLEILRDGGNACDAAVAAMVALGVVLPGSVGLGGYGGSAVIYVARARRVVAVDFDSRAPLDFRDGLVTADPQESHYGALSVTVPAVVAGLDVILRKFGAKSWRDVSQPAIRLAEQGVSIEYEHQRYLARCAPHFDQQSFFSLFSERTTPAIGSRWKQPALARLLRQLANDGPETFYVGPIAQSIVEYLRNRGGILNEDDFRLYRPQVTDAINVRCSGCEFYTPPPPSGGLTSLSIAKTIEQFDLRSIAPWSGPYFHLLSEAAKICWRERDQHLGDPDFVQIPVEYLLSSEAAAKRAEQIRDGVVLRCRTPDDSSQHTSNVLAADAEGNLISLTATQGWMYGSHLVVDDLGLVLNHGMSRYNYSPGHPNAPAASKRMQHNMAPMIGLREGRPAIAIGLPGGPKIVSVSAQLAINLAAFGATPADAISAPRLHTTGDEPLLVSAHTPAEVVEELEAFGHVVRRESDLGGPVNVLAVDAPSGRIDGASGEDTGAVAGY